MKKATKVYKTTADTPVSTLIPSSYWTAKAKNPKRDGRSGLATPLVRKARLLIRICRCSLVFGLLRKTELGGIGRACRGEKSKAMRTHYRGAEWKDNILGVLFARDTLKCG
jgi:hypothetical protein